jgi:hypothetical protein
VLQVGSAAGIFLFVLCPAGFSYQFSVLPTESAGRIFFPLLLLLISLLASVPQFLGFPLFFFTAVLRSPGGVLPLSLIFSSTVWPKFGLVRSSCSPDCLVRPTGMIFLLLQFSPLERPITVLHLSFSHRSSPIPACCSWFQVSP